SPGYHRKWIGRGFQRTRALHSDDQPWILCHTMSERDVKIHSHAAKDRSDRRSKEEDFLILPIENIVGTCVQLNVLVEVISRRSIPDIEGPNRPIITGIAKPLADESTFQVGSQRFDRLITHYGRPLVQWPLRKTCVLTAR